jgi:hypothetical protein
MDHAPNRSRASARSGRATPERRSPDRVVGGHGDEEHAHAPSVRRVPQLGLARNPIDYPPQGLVATHSFANRASDDGLTSCH